MSFSFGIIRPSGESSFFDFSNADLEVLGRIAENNSELAKSIAVLLDDAEGGVRSVPSAQIREEIAKLRAFVGAQEEHLGYIYQSTVHMPGVGKSTGSGGIGGFRIQGRACALNTGLDTCKLTKYSETGGIIEIIDVRGLKEIQTDDWGPIKISRRKKKSSLKELLARIGEHLDRLPSDEVIQIGAG